MIILLLLIFTVGIVSATDINTFKTPDNCDDLKQGVAAYNNHIDRMFYVEKAPSDFIADWFANTSTMKVFNVGDNIYRYADDQLKTYGYEEIIDVDGENYMVSIDQGSKLSPSEEKELLVDMQNFNKANNLKPVEIDSVT